jgi:exodeoxyribonuclease VII small subunit
MSETTELSFEKGYERLQTIAGRLNEEEVPVSEMCDLYAEGKGLEQALTTFLDAQRSRVEAIERGEGIQAFRITTAGGPAPESPEQPSAFQPDELQALGPDEPQAFQADEPQVFRPAAPLADDELPF